MLRLFSAGLAANLVYVVSGALKQYFIAAQLVVSDVGVYGTWVAQASLLVVLVPFPAFLDILLKGFSAEPGDHATRGSLVGGVLREFRWLSSLAAMLLVGLIAFGWVSGQPLTSAISLLLLVVSQYLGLVADISLRMFQAHQRYALFLSTRNVPSLVLIILLGLHQPLLIAVVELVNALIVGGLAFTSKALSDRDRSGGLPPFQVGVRGEQVMLWLARLVQYTNASLLRLLVPLAFGAHETGLFFFACIAQIPASLFLSVTTQIYGHSLARIRPGAWREILGIQGWFLLPNVLYALAMAALIPYWSSLMLLIPGLAAYAGIGFLVFAVALYSSVLASDCTEYLLRSRGLSKVLLLYNLSSISAQIICLAICQALGLGLENTIVLCAVMAGVVLVGYSNYSFRYVIGRDPATTG